MKRVFWDVELLSEHDLGRGDKNSCMIAMKERDLQSFSSRHGVRLADQL